MEIHLLKSIQICTSQVRKSGTTRESTRNQWKTHPGLIRNMKTVKQSATLTEYWGAESRAENNVVVKIWLFTCIIPLPLESEPKNGGTRACQSVKKIFKHRFYRSLNSEGVHENEQAVNKWCLHLNKWWKEEGSSCSIKFLQNSGNCHFKMTKHVGKMFQKI